MIENETGNTLQRRISQFPTRVFTSRTSAPLVLLSRATETGTFHGMHVILLLLILLLIQQAYLSLSLYTKQRTNTSLSINSANVRHCRHVEVAININRDDTVLYY